VYQFLVTGLRSKKESRNTADGRTICWHWADIFFLATEHCRHA